MPTLQNMLQKADTYKTHLSSAFSSTPDKDNTVTKDETNAFQYILTIAEQNTLNITEDTIKKLHQLYYSNSHPEEAGKYRTSQTVYPKAEYPLPEPEDIPRLVSHLADQIYSSGTTLHPIELAAMANKRLMDIRPFTNGSVIISELLMNLLLIHAGYPYISIYKVKKDEYYEALSAARQTYDMESFCKLIAECVLESAQKMRLE